MSWKLFKIVIAFYIIFLFVPGTIIDLIANNFSFSMDRVIVFGIIIGIFIYGAYKLLKTIKWQNSDFSYEGFCDKKEYIKNTIGYISGLFLFYIAAPISGLFSLLQVYLVAIGLNDLYDILSRFDNEHRSIIVFFGYILMLLFVYTCFIDSFRRVNTLRISRKLLFLLLIPGVNIIFIGFLVFTKPKEMVI